MRVSEYKTVIVDLDGTLYYQKPVRRAMLREMLTHFWRIREVLIVKKYRMLFERGMDERERLSYLPENAPEIIREWMIERPLPYVKKYRDGELIDRLKRTMDSGCTVIVYSDYPVQEKLDALGFIPNQAYSAEDIGSMKPDATGIIRTLCEQGIDPERCVVIGDREEKDGLLARNMGAGAVILPSNKAGRKSFYEQEWEAPIEQHGSLHGDGVHSY